MLLAATIGVGVLAASPAVAAPAQTCDPVYGCPPTSPPPRPTPTCTISAKAGLPGETVTGTVTWIPEGTTAYLALDGVVQSQGNADGSLGGGYGSATLTFRIPSDMQPGKHNVVLFGAGFSCDPTFGGGFQVLAGGVLGAETSRSAGGGAVGGASLARTGIEVALLLAIGLALVVVGANLVRDARRRRRRAALKARQRRERPTIRV